MAHDIPELDTGGLRRFGLTTAVLLVVLFGAALPWALDFAWPRWPWILAAILAGWALAAPATLRPVYRGWMHFGLMMSRVTTPLLLGAVFVVVVTPVALLMKVARRDAMARTLDPDVASYRVQSCKPPRERMERPF